MLIVAAPKSASTALLKGLGKRHGLPTKQVVFPDLPKPEEFSALAEIHSDVRALPPEVVKAFDDPDQINKQHVAPTPENLERLAGIPKVVLLRAPEQTVRAYFRGTKNGAHSGIPGFEGIDTLDAWMRRAREIGLLRELQTFCERWGRPQPDRLIIDYDDVVNRPAQTVRQIESFWDLPHPTEPPELPKERYSRYGRLQATLVFRILVPARQFAGLVYERLRRR